MEVFLQAAYSSRIEIIITAVCAVLHTLATSTFKLVDVNNIFFDDSTDLCLIYMYLHGQFHLRFATWGLETINEMCLGMFGKQKGNREGKSPPRLMISNKIALR